MTVTFSEILFTGFCSTSGVMFFLLCCDISASFDSFKLCCCWGLCASLLPSQSPGSSIIQSWLQVSSVYGWLGDQGSLVSSLLNISIWVSEYSPFECQMICLPCKERKIQKRNHLRTCSLLSLHMSRHILH